MIQMHMAQNYTIYFFCDIPGNGASMPFIFPIKRSHIQRTAIITIMEQVHGTAYRFIGAKTNIKKAVILLVCSFRIVSPQPPPQPKNQK